MQKGDIKLDTFVDFFCGIGGFRIPMEKRGLQCVFSCDYDSDAMFVYSQNFYDIPTSDIRSIEAHDVPDHDVFCAGFPCQSFSIAGKKLGEEDRRGKLFYDILRIVRVKKPKIILLENVPHIKKIDNSKTFIDIYKSLSHAGYRFFYSTLSAHNFGVPTIRKRVYFVCIRNDLLLYYKEPKPIKERVYLEDVLEDDSMLDDYLFIKNQQIIINRDEPEKTVNKSFRVGLVGGKTYSQGARIYSPKGFAVTLTAHGGGMGAKTGLYLINGKVRRLSLTECKRIMSFPDEHIVSSGHRGWQQLGNAIIPKMVGIVFDSIVPIP